MCFARGTPRGIKRHPRVSQHPGCETMVYAVVKAKLPSVRSLDIFFP